MKLAKDPQAITRSVRHWHRHRHCLGVASFSYSDAVPRTWPALLEGTGMVASAQHGTPHVARHEEAVLCMTLVRLEARRPAQRTDQTCCVRLALDPTTTQTILSRTPMWAAHRQGGLAAAAAGGALPQVEQAAAGGDQPAGMPVAARQALKRGRVCHCGHCIAAVVRCLRAPARAPAGHARTS